MEADPELGLLQSLPRVINARSRFGRTMQFSASFYSPIFARGLAMMQGRTGPFWGHNAHRPHPCLRGKLRPAGAVAASRPLAAIS